MARLKNGSIGDCGLAQPRRHEDNMEAQLPAAPCLCVFVVKVRDLSHRGKTNSETRGSMRPMRHGGDRGAAPPSTIEWE